MIIQLTKDQYDKAEKYSQMCWAENGKSGVYGNGIANTKEDKHRVSRIGKLAEIAVGDLLGLNVDYSYSYGGDDCDLNLFGMKIDVKCSLTSKYKCLVKAENGLTGAIPIKSDIYIATRLVSDCREQKTASIEVFGYITNDMLCKLPLKPGKYGFEKRKGGWLNYEIYFTKVKPIGDLIKIKEILC